MAGNIVSQNNIDAVMAMLAKIDLGKLVELVGTVHTPAVAAGAGETVVAEDVCSDDQGLVGLTGGSVGSWSDEMDSVDSSVKGVPVVSDRVRESVTFGGFGKVDKNPVVKDVVKSESGLFARYVRTPAANSLRAALMSYGVKMPKSSNWHVAVVTYTAATMPNFFVRGKDQLRTFGVLGDAALVAGVAADSIEHGQVLASMQAVRNEMLSDVHLMKVFASSKFVDCVSFGAGVNPAMTKTGATALEAIFGIVAYYRSPRDVMRLAHAMGLLKDL